MDDYGNVLPKRGRGRPRKQPGEPVKKTPGRLEADRLIEETVNKETVEEETGLDKETLARRLSRSPSPNYHQNPYTPPPDEPKKITVSDLIHKNLEVARLPKIDLTDPEQVEARILEYFAIEDKYGNRPTVAGLGVCLNGMDRRRIWEIATGSPTNGRGDSVRLPRESSDVIKKYYAILTNLWEDYMQSGKINPVSGIFLGKNNFGYRDQTEYVLTPNTQPDFDEKAIRARLSLPDSDTDSDSD